MNIDNYYDQLILGGLVIDSSSWPCRVCIADVAQEGVLANKAESSGRYLDNVDSTLKNVELQ